ncbi:MAG: V-type ATP synthase subunit D [Defluviitaleaceae bacterium]|nr:V-type ATP synthase subunit D [Defluviitaleaceae bacterium]
MSKEKLIQTNKVLKLSIQGYELLDKKAFILKKEIDDLKDRRLKTKESINDLLKTISEDFVLSSINMGLNNIKTLTKDIEVDNSFEMLKTSIMGIEVNIVKWQKQDTVIKGLYNHENLYKTVSNMEDLKELLILLAMLEDSIKKLGTAFRKTRVRVNALKNIVIPRNEKLAKSLKERIEEQDKERYFYFGVI